MPKSNRIQSKRRSKSLNSIDAYDINESKKKRDIDLIHPSDLCDENNNNKRFKSHWELPNTNANEPRFNSGSLKQSASLANVLNKKCMIQQTPSMLDINRKENKQQSRFKRWKQKFKSTSSFRSIKNEPIDQETEPRTSQAKNFPNKPPKNPKNSGKKRNQMTHLELPTDEFIPNLPQSKSFPLQIPKSEVQPTNSKSLGQIYSNPTNFTSSQYISNSSDMEYFRIIMHKEAEINKLKLRIELLEQDAQMHGNSINSYDSGQCNMNYKADLQREITRLEIKLCEKETIISQKEANYGEILNENNELKKSKITVIELMKEQHEAEIAKIIAKSTVDIENILNDKENEINRLYSVKNKLENEIEFLEKETDQFRKQINELNNKNSESKNLIEEKTNKLKLIQNEYETYKKLAKSHGIDTDLLSQLAKSDENLKHHQHVLKETLNEKETLKEIYEQKLKSYDWMLSSDMANKLQLLLNELNICTDELSELVKKSIDIAHNESIDIDQLLRFNEIDSIDLIDTTLSNIANTAAIINKEFVMSKINEIKVCRVRLQDVRNKITNDYAECIASNTTCNTQ